MFGKGRGNGLNAKTPVHEVMTRHIWPGGGFAGAYRDHMIKLHTKRLREPVSKPMVSPKPKRPF
jgi:hypothetical protein